MQNKPKKIVKRTPVKMTLGYYLRNLPELAVWRANCRAKYGSCCAVSGIKPKSLKQLHIHHAIPFAQVRDEALEELGLPLHVLRAAYKADQLDSLAKLIIKKHENAVGIPMTRKIHRLFHSTYGYKATYDDWKVFKVRWDKGEFTK